MTASTAPATNPALTALIAGLADNKYRLGTRYAEWCTAAPALESAVAAAAMAQDEIGHARSFYPLLRDLAGDSPETEAETRTQFTNAPFLNQPFSAWTDFVAANFLFDTAITILLESARESSFQDLGTRARRILEEEPLHWLHGEAWTKRLGAMGPGVRHATQESLNATLPESLGWFEVAQPQLVDEQVLGAGAEALRREFVARVTPVYDAAGLVVS
jgi:phenylacetate-CoA oxygenase PaaI subunit